MKKNKSLITTYLLLLIILALLLSSANIFSDSNSDRPVVYTITIEDIITQGTTEYIQRSIETAEETDADALVILLNTPGGIVDATLDILEDILEADIPVLTYVSPQGAIAASAGSFILVSGHLAAMTPGSTCGAAMPVTLSMDEEGGSTEAADQKTINFLAGHIKSIANERGHNGETASKFVTENLTLGADEALESGVIDIMATSLNDLLLQANGTELQIHGKTVILETADADILPIEMTTRERATNLVSNPQISFVLVILGVYGLIIGFNAPETYIPEVAGAIALVVGLFGLGMFNINIFAAIIIVLGIILLIAEALTPTYGVLSVAGILSIIIGGIFLPKEPLMPEAWISGFRSFIIGIGIGASILMLIILKGILKVRKRPPKQGPDEFISLTGTVAEIDDTGYMVKVNGELWHAVSKTNTSLKIGQEVKIMRREGIELFVAETEDDQ